MRKLFESVLSRVGWNKIEHVEVTYLKADKKQVKYEITLPHDLLSLTHTQGKRWELQKVTATFSEAVEKWRWRVFEGARETFLIHQLKKLLSTEARKQLRKNLTDCEAIVYSDLKIFIPDIFWTLSSKSNGNKTLQPLDPQIQRFKLYHRLVNFKTVKIFFIFCLKVWEMAVLQPSEPENLMFTGKLSFRCPS